MRGSFACPQKGADMADLEDFAVLVAEDLNQLAATVDKIKLANTSRHQLGGAQPSFSAPPGWIAEDVDTGMLWKAVE